MLACTLSRRTVLERTAAAVAAAGAAAVGIGYASTDAAVAVEATDRFRAADVRVERNDGAIDAVTVAPELEVAWSDFGGGLESVAVTLSAAVEGYPGFDVLFDGDVGRTDAIAVEGDDLGSIDGAVDLTFEPRDLTAVGDDVTTADFGGDLGPGEEAVTTVELTLRVDVGGAQGDAATAFETVAFDVAVANPEGDASTVGRANTDAE